MNTQKNVKNGCTKYILLPIFNFLSQPSQMFNLCWILPKMHKCGALFGLYILCFK